MPPNLPLRSMLVGGDRRSIGRANEVVALVEANPGRFHELIACLWDEDPSVVLCAADAAEKLSRAQPALLAPHKAALLGLLAEATQIELRWHLALIAPRLELTLAQCRQVFATLQRYREDRSSIVKTFALQGMADLLPQEPALKSEVLDELRTSARCGTAAMRARSRILLRQLEP